MPIKKHLIQYTIYFNIIILYLLLIKYHDVNLSPNLLKNTFLGTHQIGLLFGFLCSFGLLDAMIKIYLAFRNKFYLKKWKNLILSLASLVIAGHCLIIINLDLYWMISLKKVIIGIEDNILIIEFLLLIVLLINKTDKINQKSKNAFALYYLSRYSIFIFLIIPIKEVRIIFSSLGLLYFNMLPYFWIKYYAEKIRIDPIAKGQLHLFAKKFQLTKRELQIIELIIEGKNNTEIAETLFISQHTVKNHVYNIFQKLGVKHRYELMHLINKTSQ